MSKTKDVHLHLVVDAKLLEEIEAWRERQEFPASRSEILRRLIMAGLQRSKRRAMA